MLLLVTIGCTPDEKAHGPGGTSDPTETTDPTVTSAPTDDADGDGVATDLDCDDADADVGPWVTLDGEPYADLVAALGDAADGSVIHVCRGTYAGPFAAASAVTLVADFGAAETTLDGGSASGSPVLSLVGGSTVRGFTVTGGSGGGIASDGELAVEDCVVTGNRGTNGGGISAASVSMWRTTVSENRADHGGGVWVSERAELEECVISGNTATVGGGGAWLDGADWVGGTVTGNTCADGAKGDGGGGLGIAGSASVTGATISGNTAGFGGGIGSSDGALVLAEVAVTGNSASYGGGIGLRGGSLTFGKQTEVSGNDASIWGGGVDLEGAGMTGGVIRANTSQMGAGVYAGDVTGELVGMTVEENVGDYGAGMYLDGGEPTVTDAVVTENEGGEGAGIWSGARATLSGVRVLGNVATGDGGGVYSSDWLTVEGGEISYNEARSGAAMFLMDWGTGFPDLEPTWTMSAVIVSENLAASRCSGVAMDYNENEDGLAPLSALTVADARFSGNNSCDVSPNPDLDDVAVEPETDVQCDWFGCSTPT